MINIDFANTTSGIVSHRSRQSWSSLKLLSGCPRRYRFYQSYLSGRQHLRSCRAQDASNLTLRVVNVRYGTTSPSECVLTKDRVPPRPFARALAMVGLGVKGGCRHQVDGTAGLPSAPEMPCAPRQLRLVPTRDVRRTSS